MPNRQTKPTNTKTSEENCIKQNAAIWYNKICRQKQLIPKYISVMINGKNQRCLKTVLAATHFRINHEIKFLYIKNRNSMKNCKTHI